ncbi:carbon monoxide dehydrogenase subunit G [Stappia sp. F7233]|uniref:Carbon monoxide dehydrogenase subunit G n=1 Tax=Stappia albiluteola TaxID=2758565 RepID=A0A839A9W5_9HYPH|nr:carbon monoxide dehydrogenase subunit G [Stappia albiluteola]MBA5775838.1 carbon monoxide dehydrogenase subunit G [Stappia albiluteola]
MDMTGEYRIAAPRQRVWEALNDPQVLKACIPGCETLEKTSDTEMNAEVTAKIGPVKAKFKGEVTLQDIVPPQSYRIVGEGKGGVAGFAKGSADVHLAEDGAETILRYDVKAQVGGKLAQLGSRLIDSTARKMADEFFGNFRDIVGSEAAAETAEPDPGVIEEAQSIANEHLAEDVGTFAEKVEHTVGDAVHKAEERVEEAAAKGAFGGPLVWGMIALAAIIVVLALAS